MNQDYNQFNNNQNVYQPVEPVQEQLPKKKSNLPVIIVIIILIAIGVGVYFYLNNNKDNNTNTNNGSSKQETVKSKWVSYDSVKHYTRELLKPINLDDIVIEKPILKVEKEDKSVILDFTNTDYFPSNMDQDGIEGMKYVLIGSVSDVIGTKTSEYDSLLQEGDYNNGCTGEKGKDAYYTCYFVINNTQVAIGINIESASIEDAKQTVRDRLSIITHDETNAITLKEFNQQNIQKVKFNLSKLNLEGKTIDAYPPYTIKNGEIKLYGLSSSMYSTTPFAIMDGLTVNISTSYIEPETTFEVLEISDGIRLYKPTNFCSYYAYNGYNMNFSYILGIVENDKEYYLQLSYRDNYTGTEDKGTLCQSETYVKEIENKIINIIKNNF